MNSSALEQRIASQWDAEIVPQITEYIRIPAKSPHFDPQWESHGHIERVIQLALAWVTTQPIKGLTAEIVRIPGRTPLLFIEVPASVDHKGHGSVMLYWHLDKQPEMVGWHEGAGPWEPRFVDGKLYGRGGADDGYAVFAALSALAALEAQEEEGDSLQLLLEDDSPDEDHHGGMYSMSHISTYNLQKKCQ